MHTLIPEAAVEAAAEVTFLRHGAKYYSQMGPWAELEPRFRTAWLEDARLAIEAAAPHMLAEAWDEGREATVEAYDGRGDGSNPYRPAT